MGMDNSNAHEEKIYVAVRARPLNEKEISKNDLSDWECINNTTIVSKNTIPTAYTFDRVFGFDSPTKHVYDEAAKKIALSVLTGINSTIFAYGQTGSGKTFTMSGITECAIADIYDYIHNHPERKFVLKFSAMEIYNEAVRDLLRMDATSLRLLDDPERGTVVANLTEVNLRDRRQLKELLSVCEAQRKIGETSLNELSSRSHQILRLTVESEGVDQSLTASVSFVDLAGSERASQSGTRLKEGSHINRSLLTLGTVIRKLSKGGKNGHIPYRDSKLTRILQNSLGGNARSAVICTMSPAHSQVEQSRNTLHFANCANQVSTSARINVVMSEKALVKQLQKELSRLESELNNIWMRSLSHSKSALKEKQDLIQKMDEEIRELTHQRDVAQSRVEDMMRSWTDSSSEVVSRSSSASISATSSPHNRQPLADTSCEAILASIMIGGNNKSWQIETAANQESLSRKKTLVAIMRDNSRRLSSASLQSPTAQSRGSSDAIDALSRQSSASATTSVALSNKISAYNSSLKSKPKAVKQIEHDLENKESRVSWPDEAKCGTPTNAKKKRRSRETTVGEDWKTEFERRKREIIKLWDVCHIPLVHRSYFCLLFKGDPSDAVYMEVEHRRLSFLKNGEAPSSPKGLQREREMLSRRMLKKLSSKEREALFDKWGIDVKSKQRRQQVCRKLWSDTESMEHIRESAEIVAKLVGLNEAGEAPKEMFGLTLAPKPTNSKPSFSWRNPIPSIIS